MKQRFNFFLLCIIFLARLSTASATSSIVTTGYMGDRFGDNLWTYMKAKWVERTYNIPFYYKPFKYSEGLALHDLEQRWSPNNRKNKKVIQLGNRWAGKATQLPGHEFFVGTSNTEYVIGFFLGGCKITDTDFLQSIKHLIQPKTPIKKINIPEERTSVALHVRTGGGFDSENIIKRFPTKFPPQEYYIEQVCNISEMLDDCPLYVHIFTDDKNPKKLVAMYKQALDKKNIVWGCRESGNRHNTNILDDFFGIMQFDCLVRAVSKFSHVGEMLGNHKIVISPLKHEWQSDENGKKNILRITEVKISTA